MSLAPDELTRALQRVSSAPRDPSAWIALGDAEAAFEDLDAAEHAYRTALRIRPDALAYAQLGFLLYGKGTEAEALAYLVEAKRLGADVPLLDQTIARLRERPAMKAPGSGDLTLARADRPVDLDAGVAPPPPANDAFDGGADAGSERKLACTVPVHAEGEPGAGRRGMLVDVMVEGHAATLLVDTGATLSIVSEDFAGRAGLAIGSKRFGVMTANGRTTFGSAHARAVSLGGRDVRDVTIALCPDCVHGVADGLLGLDLQAALGLAIDPRNHELRFADCTP